MRARRSSQPRRPRALPRQGRRTKLRGPGPGWQSGAQLVVGLEAPRPRAGRVKREGRAGHRPRKLKAPVDPNPLCAQPDPQRSSIRRATARLPDHDAGSERGQHATRDRHHQRSRSVSESAWSSRLGRWRRLAAAIGLFRARAPAAARRPTRRRPRPDSHSPRRARPASAPPALRRRTACLRGSGKTGGGVAETAARCCRARRAGRVDREPPMPRRASRGGVRPRRRDGRSCSMRPPGAP